MTQDFALRTVAEALRVPTVVDFVRASVKAGYLEFFGDYSAEVCRMVDHAFDELSNSQSDAVEPDRLVEATSALLHDTFRKSDPSFWFNRIYHHYKTQLKPEADFQRLQKLLPGEKILDYGCGSGYLDVRLERGGYKVFTTDVLDYRYPEARHLPFVQMASATDIASTSLMSRPARRCLSTEASNRLPPVCWTAPNDFSSKVLSEGTARLIRRPTISRVSR